MNIFHFPDELRKCGLQTIGLVLNKTTEAISEEWFGGEEPRAIDTIGYELSEESVQFLQKLIDAKKRYQVETAAAEVRF